MASKTVNHIVRDNGSVKGQLWLHTPEQRAFQVKVFGADSYATSFTVVTTVASQVKGRTLSGRSVQVATGADGNVYTIWSDRSIKLGNHAV